MRVPPTEPVDFFSQALTRVRHELVLAVIPDLVSVRKSVRNVATGRFNYVFPHWFRIKWRELAMPIDDFSLTVGHWLHYGRGDTAQGLYWESIFRDPRKSIQSAVLEGSVFCG